MFEVSDAAQASNLVAAVITITVLVFTSYLMIYNVMYISISRDVRFFGLLKTIGTTPKQIRRIVAGQILRLCSVGIPLGLAFATIFSFAIIPILLSNIGNFMTGTIISFSPPVYIGATLFAFLTALWGAAQPAKKAADVSPVEAAKYTSMDMTGSPIIYSAYGKPYRMAFRNMFRDRKRSFVVLLSLFLGMTSFVIITTIVSSMDTDSYIASYVKHDFTLINNTTITGADVAAKQKFDDVFLERIRSIPGFAQMRYDTRNGFRLTYSESFCAHLEKVLDNVKGLTPDRLAWAKENFTCLAIGVDGSSLEGTFDSSDIEAFERGDFLLFATDDPSLYDAINSVEIGEADMSPNGRGAFACIFCDNIARM